MLISDNGRGTNLRAVCWDGRAADIRNAVLLCPSGTTAQVEDDGTLILVLPGERHCLPSARRGEWLVSLAGREPYSMGDREFWSFLERNGYLDPVLEV